MIARDGIGLCAVETDDLRLLKEWRNDPELRQYLRQWKELNWIDQDRWFNSINGSRDNLFFSIKEEKEKAIPGRTVSFVTHDEIATEMTWALIGACGLSDIDWRNRTAEISIYIGKAYIDERATKALDILLGYSFYELNLWRVWGEVYKFDTKKYNLFTNAGFKQEGIMRGHYFHDGARHDSILLGLLREEYK